MKFNDVIKLFFGPEIEELFLLGDHAVSGIVIEDLLSKIDCSTFFELDVSQKLPTFIFEDREYSFGSFFELLSSNDFIIWHNFIQMCVYYSRKIQSQQEVNVNQPNDVYSYLRDMLEFNQFPINMLSFNDVLIHLKEVAPETSEIFNEFKKFRFGEWNSVVQNPTLTQKKKYRRIAAHIVTLVSTNVSYFSTFSPKTFKGSVKEFLIKKNEIEQAFISAKNTIIFMIKSTKDFKIRQLA